MPAVPTLSSSSSPSSPLSSSANMMRLAASIEARRDPRRPVRVFYLTAIGVDRIGPEAVAGRANGREPEPKTGFPVSAPSLSALVAVIGPVSVRVRPSRVSTARSASSRRFLETWFAPITLLGLRAVCASSAETCERRERRRCKALCCLGVPDFAAAASSSSAAPSAARCIWLHSSVYLAASVPLGLTWPRIRPVASAASLTAIPLSRRLARDDLRLLLLETPDGLRPLLPPPSPLCPL